MITPPGVETWPVALGRYPELIELLAQCRMRLSTDSHGDAEKWISALNKLPDMPRASFALEDCIKIGADDALTGPQKTELKEALRELLPWRKGPWCYFGVEIDTEWRSDWKWRRVCKGLGSLKGKTVLDVGAGNGYYGWRMLEAGAEAVVGVDPTTLYCMQHMAASKYLAPLATRHVVLPLQLEELPAGPLFDVVFSMGVLYHRREPLEHIRKLLAHTRPGGQIVLETLIVDEQYGKSLAPSGRYARMRNVHVIPTIPVVHNWLIECGCESIEVVDITTTTTDEQRSTDWMPFESLEQALDPVDALKTIEGYPSPVRATVMARHAKPPDP